MDGFSKRSGAFSMDDSDVEDAVLATGFEIVRNQCTEIRRFEGVEIEHPIDRYLDGIIVHY